MSAEFFLDETAAEEQRIGERLIREIEQREVELVNLRQHRDAAFVRAAEMRTAANILREVGLRAEMTSKGPLVSVDYQPTRPPSAEPAASEL
jgi:hypothetical protein